jgi:TrmH family RNA methyltransferase
VIRDIAGRHNHSVKTARKLQRKKYRREHGLIVCEGMDLLVAAVEGGAAVRDVLVRRELVGQLPAELFRSASLERTGTPAGDVHQHVVDIGLCDQETLDYAGSLGGAVDVVFTCSQPAWSLGDIDLGRRVTIYLDGLGDPGNVGTLVRSATAFGLGGVLCSPGTADPFGPKAMRAGMGAQFMTPVVVEVASDDLEARCATLKERGDPVPALLVADARGDIDIRDTPDVAGVVVVLGSEREGSGAPWKGSTRVSVPQAAFESLNVAMAGTILAYELWRSRRERQSGN